MKDVEKLIKFCSKLGDIFEYPYFFNWSPPTNHRDNTSDGEIRELGYAIFRIGMYPPPKDIIIDGQEYSDGHQSPIEKQVFFGQVNRILDFTFFNHFLFPDIMTFSDYKIKSFDDLKKYKDELKQLFNEYLTSNTII